MLFRLVLVRMLPMIMLKLGRDRNYLKKMVILIGIIYMIFFVAAVWEILAQKGWLGIFLVPVSLFPHFVLYGFGMWMILRCVYREWSDRVWKRIYFLTILCIGLGILAENYINPHLLQIVFKIFK